MASATFLIPARDAGRTQEIEAHMESVGGLRGVRVARKPFDPFSAAAELQPLDEAQVTVTYDAAETSAGRIREAFDHLGIHVLDYAEDE